MIRVILQKLFGCSHKRISRPMTPAAKPGVARGETYVVCLDCGQQFAYDTQEMRMGERRTPVRPNTWS